MGKKNKKYKLPRLNCLSVFRKKTECDVLPVKSWKLYFFAVILLLLVGSVSFFEYSYRDKFYPGVSIGDTYVGGKTYEEASLFFGERATSLKESGLTVKFVNGEAEKVVIVPMFARGLTSDKSFEYFSLGTWYKTRDNAFNFGRTGSFSRRIQEQCGLLFRRERFDLPFTLYETAVESFLVQEADPFLKKTEPSRFAMNAKEQVYIIPEKNGESLDFREILPVIKRKLAAYDFSPESFTIKTETSWISKERLTAFLPLAEELAQKTSFSFHYKTRTWNVGGKTFVAWLTMKNNKDLGVDNEKLDAFLSKTISSVINDPPINSRFEMHYGKLKEIIRGEQGSVVDAKATAIRIESILGDMQSTFAKSGVFATLSDSTGSDDYINASTGVLDIPVEITKSEPKLTQETIDRYKITELVGVSKTRFKGSSADRITNITVGAARLNGLLIAPNEEFSAVNAIGHVSEEAGYTKEYVIKDNKSVKELGGGLCQIATTLFRLALNSGLPITERTNHRYTVSYYGPGLDATIYGPHPDLRFVNDTGNYLLLQSRVVGTDLVLEFYGQKDKRNVEISEPVLTERIPAPVTKYIVTNELYRGVQKCSETPKDGITADVTYRVEFPGGEVREQKFHSVYQPWQKICLFGIR